MRAVIVSKALIHAAYRGKLREMTRLGAEVIAVVPPAWREGGSLQTLEPDLAATYETVVLPLRWNGHFHLHYYRGLDDILRASRPDIVHLDEEPYNLATYLGMRAAADLRLPAVYFSWQNLVRSYPPPVRWMEQWVYRHAAGGIAGSHDVESVLRNKGFSGPISVVPQFGVDPSVFHPGPARHQRFTVGYFNRLIPGKAPLLALRAFAELGDNARMIVVGDGPLRAELERQIAEAGIQSRVELRPRVPSEQMPELYREVDVVTLPSITTPSWKEQFGRVLIEAMASGTPVVGSMSGEIPNVVGDAGLLIPEGDAAALSGALRQLCDDPVLRADLGARGRGRVLEHFTHERIAIDTLSAYEAAIAVR